MLNSSEILRGFTDTLILARLYTRDGYGYELNNAVTKLAGGTFVFKEATLYTSFRRLEESGCIGSYWGDETTGARRRYYAITEAGRKTYLENLEDWQKIKELIDKLIRSDEGALPQGESANE